MVKKFGYKRMVDPQTGEEQTFVLIGHEFEDADFVKVPFVSIELIMGDKDLAKSAMRVLSYIIREKITFDKYEFSLSYMYDIKGKLDLSEMQFHRAVKKLCDKDILVRIGRGRFMLNPRYIRYGRADQLRKFETEYDRVKERSVKNEERN